MNFDRFQGDPKISIGLNGARLTFKGGQPIMDQGLENFAVISLFTKKGWVGNVLFDSEDEKIGSDFEENASKSITLQSINNTEDAARKALENDAFGGVEVNIVNPSSNQLNVSILIEPPGKDAQELIISRNGLNWIAQKLNPANTREG